MERFGKTRLRRGFTLAEVLVVVAILAILLTFAAPALIHAFVRMHLRALDNSACSIFAAAQNSMTAMAGSGELEKFADGLNNDVYPLVEPSDFDKTPSADYNTLDNLRYLDSWEDDHKAALKQLLPGGSIESKLAEHRYIVEYNRVTGAVYAVWYSNEKAFEEPAADPLAYDDFGNWDRDFEKRVEKSPLIGYYGGSGVDYARVNQMPVPKLTLTNAEELRLRIEMPASSSGASGASGSPLGTSDIGLTVTVKGETSNVEKTILGKGAPNADLADVRLGPEQTGNLMLDTLKTYEQTTFTANALNGTSWTIGKQFKDWAGTGSDTLLPGENITVTVTTYYAGTDGKLYLSQSASVSGSSLFANVTKNSAPDDGYTAEVAYGRHLQNLHANNRTARPPFESGEAIGVTKAVQTQEIDFAEKAPATPGSPADDPIYYWASTYEETAGPGYRAFVPIKKRVAYDGQGLPIRGLYSESTGGLFGRVDADASGKQVEWNNIVLIDTKVDVRNNTDGSPVGALAGSVANVNITNCQVYLEKNAVPYDEDHPTPEQQLKGNGNVGGLVGQMQGADNSITDSFAATVISGKSIVGGLVGSITRGTSGSAGNSLKIFNSYAACYLTVANYTGSSSGRAGGLVGSANSDVTLTITNSYAAGIIADAQYAAGLANTGNWNTTVEDSYAAVRYTTPRSYPVFSTTWSHRDTYDKGYYVAQSGISYDDDPFGGTKVTAKELSEMLADGTPGVPADAKTLGGEWYHLPAEKEGATPPTNPTYAAFPYRQTEETAELSTPYPYPQLAVKDPADTTGTKTLPVLHYGDWLEAEDAGALLVYFERYSYEKTSPCGFYALELTKDTDGNPVVTEKPLLNTLWNSDETADDVEKVWLDGYRLISAADLTDAEYTIDGGAAQKLTKVADTDPLVTALHDVDGFGDYKVYTFTDDYTPVEKLYHKLELNGQTFYYNTHFACEAYNVPADADEVPDAPTAWLAKPGAGGKGTDDPDKTDDDYAGCVVVRTARHLGFMAAYTNENTTTQQSIPPALQNVARGWSYHQLLDISYNSYDSGNRVAGGIMGLGEPDVGAILGGRNDQHPAYLDDGSYDGHGHRISFMSIGSRNRNSDPYVGLFGTLTGSATVQNITFYLCDVDASMNATATGLLAGCTADGTHITNCTLIGTGIDAAKSSYTGALVGSAAGGTTIEKCGAYASGSGTPYFQSTVSGGDTVGGLIGMVGSGTTVKESYAAVRVTGKTNVGGFAGQINGSKEMKDCYASGDYTCHYYWAGSGSTNLRNYINVTATGDNGRAGGFVGNLMNYEPENNDGTGFKDNTDFNLTGTLYSTCSVSGKYTGLFAAHIADCTELPEKYAGTNIAATLKAATVYGIGVAFAFSTDASSREPTAPTNADTEAQYFAPVSKIVRPAGAKAEPYYNTQTTYPYATGLTVHHGDWPVFEGVFYWEKEAGKYHYSVHAALGGTSLVESALCTDHHAGDATLDNMITDFGYGLFSNATIQNLSKWNQWNPVDTSEAANEAQSKFTAAYPAASTVRMLTPATPPTSDEGPYFKTSKLTKTSILHFEVNRRFADAIDVVCNPPDSLQPTNMGQGPATPEHPDWKPYYIRTVQQLDCIPEDSGGGYDESAYYVQTHDLYGQGPDGSHQYYGSNNHYGSSTSSDRPTYAYNGASSFSGTYDGQLYRILELNIDCTVTGTASKAAGLFATAVDATLKNIILYSPSGKATITAADAEGSQGAAGLAVEASGTIRNCIVAGYTITVPKGGCAGGLVVEAHPGSNSTDLTVQNCAAVNTIEFAATNGPVAGGLIGWVNSSGGNFTFENCYAGGAIKVAPGAGTAEVMIGGILASTNTNTTYTNVYSYMELPSVTGVLSSYYGIGPKSTDGTTGSASYTNCYYWSGGLPAGKTATDSAETGVTPCGLAGLAGLERAAFGGDAAHTFVPAKDDAKIGLTDKNKTNPADPYPFPAVVREVNADGEATGDYVHYGEWPLEFLVAYYEKYTDDQYGFYALERSADGTVTPLINTLRTDETNVAKTDGYAILYNTTPTNNTFTLNDGPIGGYTLSGSAVQSSAVKIGAARYTMYIPLFGGLWKYAKDAAKAEGASYYQKLTMANGQVLLFNPLFACEAVNGRTTATAASTLPTEAVAKPDLPEADKTANDNYAGHIIIRTARQLANVVEMTSPTDSDGNPITSYPNRTTAYQAKTYDQLLGIDYAKYERENSSDPKQDSYGFVTGTKNTRPQRPLQLSSGTYNGHGYAIRRLYTGRAVINGAFCCGLVGYAGPDSTLENITLINTSAIVSEDHFETNPIYLGALAGLTQGTVENCGVYVEGVAGQSYNTADAAYAEWTVANNSNVQDFDDHVGGLIGRVEGGTIRRSYAAVRVVGEQRVGGFAGSMEKCTIADCYVGGHTVNGEYTLIADNDSVANVHTELNFNNYNARPYVGGFAGVLTGDVTFAKNSICYTTASVGTSQDHKDGSEATVPHTVGQFVGQGQDYVKLEKPTAAADKRAILYATGSGFKLKSTYPSGGYDQITPVNEDYLTDPDPFAAKAAGFVTVPYDTALKGAAYPYQTNLTAHHGDWPKFTMSGLMYLEYTIDPADPTADPTFKYHYIAADSNGKTYDKYVAVGADGKAVETTDNVFANDTPDGKSVTGLYVTFINTAEGNTPPAPLTTGNVLPAVGTAVKAKLATMMPGFDFNLYACQIYDKGTYRGVELAGGKTGYFNLAFADALSMEENTIKALGSESSPFIVRTVRQLQDTSRVNISDTTTHLYYKQTHDIVPVPDGLTQWRLDNSYNAPSLINGTYYGGGYRVLDVNVTGTSAAGLFYLVKDSTVYDLVLYSPTGAGTIKVPYNNSSLHAGGITADLERSTLNGCVAAGYTVSGYVAGGLVGQATGQCAIVNCSATTKLAGAFIGGLAGGTGYSSTDVLTVTNSYAGGTVTSVDNSGGYYEIDGLAGGDEYHVVFKDVYSYLDMSIAPNGGRTYGIGNGTVDPASKLCAYWAGGVPKSFIPQYMTATAMTFKELKEATQAFDAKANEVYAPADSRAAGLYNQVADTVDDFTAFPFAALVQQQSTKRVHYGELPELRASAVFYWEKEQTYSWTGSSWVADADGVEYHYHLMGVSNLTKAENKYHEVNTLCTLHHDDGKIHQIDRYGYGELTVGDGDPGKEWGGYYLGMEKPVTKLDSDESAVKALIEKDLGVSTKSFAVYKCDKALSNEYNQYKYNLSIPGVERTIFFTVDFADLYLTEKHNDTETFTIRSARQLDNIFDSTSGPTITSTTYKQTHDVGAVGYLPKNAQSVDPGNPGPLPKYEYSKYTAPDIKDLTYNGQSYRILELSLYSDDDTALFKIASGTNKLENMVLYSPSGTARIEATSDQKAVGGLIAYLNIDLDKAAGWHTTIENCAVAGYTFYTPRNTAGGLVGYANHDLTITNCEAVNTFHRKKDENINKKGENPLGIGGLVGPVGNGIDASPSLTIKDSYAGGVIDGNSTLGSVGGLYGGGRKPNGGTIQNAYSYMDLSSCWMDTSTLNNTDNYTINIRKEVNTIGHGASGSAATNLYYYNGIGYLPYYENNTENTHQWDYQGEGNNQGTATSDLGNIGIGQHPAKSYVPGSDGLKNSGSQTSLRAVVKDAGGKYVHYGILPGDLLGTISAVPAMDGPAIIELTCTCTEKCTADSICETCPVCSVDYNACQPVDPAEADLTGGDDPTGDDVTGDEPGEGEPTPEPTATPDPNAAPVEGEPTPTPETTPEPEPAPTPETTAEPTAEPTETPEATAEPTAEPTPEPTPAPAAEATSTPEPTPAEAAPGEGGGPE